MARALGGWTGPDHPRHPLSPSLATPPQRAWGAGGRSWHCLAPASASAARPGPSPRRGAAPALCPPFLLPGHLTGSPDTCSLPHAAPHTQPTPRGMNRPGPSPSWVVTPAAAGGPSPACLLAPTAGPSAPLSRSSPCRDTPSPVSVSLPCRGASSADQSANPAAQAETGPKLPGTRLRAGAIRPAPSASRSPVLTPAGALHSQDRPLRVTGADSTRPGCVRPSTPGLSSPLPSQTPPALCGHRRPRLVPRGEAMG